MTQAPTPGPLSEMFGYTDWRKHDGGPNPAPDQSVDLIWGFGLVECQPSHKVNWGLKWDWRLHGPQIPLAPTAPVETSGSDVEVDDDHLPFDMALDLLCTADDMAVYAGAGSANVAWVARHAKERLSALRPQPSGETRGAVAELIEAAIVRHDPTIPLDSTLDDADAILALLSARPLALGGQS